MSCSEPTKTYDIGDDVTIVGEWTTSAGELVDPAAVFCSVKKPDEVVTDYEYGVGADIVKVEDGKYKLVVDATQPGRWFYRWFSTGDGKAAGEREFVVARSQFS